MEIKLINVRSLVRKRILMMIMKVFIFLMCTTVFCFNTENLFSQEKVKIEKDQLVTVDHVFKIIKKQTKFNFVYPKRLFKDMPKIQLKKGEIKIVKLLQQSLSSNNLNFELTENNTIIINKNIESKEIKKPQKIVVSGVVTDVNGQPLPGVNILVKGTTIGTQTDFDGNYSINIPDGSNILVFSYIGFTTKEVSINGQATINVIMIEDTTTLDEVVIVGYGSVKRSDLTGSVASISSEDISEIPTNTVSSLLQGRAAGVQVTTGDGAPGGGINIRIRGTSTITGSTEPLYIIDGFPVNSDNDNLYVSGGFNEGNGEGNDTNKVRPNALSFINPADIESIEILKDASATAIYGSRGANGVVLIKTKSGKLGKTKVNVNYSMGAQTIIKKLNVLDGPAWVARLTEAEINNGIAPGDVRYNGSDEFHPLAQNAETNNWQDILYRTALVQDLSMSFSGGTENTKYLFSGKYYDAEGIMVGSGYKDMQARMNLDQKVGRFNFKSNVLVSHNINDRVPTGAGFNYNAVTQGLGYSPAINPDWFDDEKGAWYVDPKTSGPGVYTNPLRFIKGIDDQIATNRILGNVQMDVNLLNSLKLTGSYGIDYSDATRDTYTNRTLTIAGSAVNNGLARVNNGKSTRTNTNAYLTYNQSFKSHNLSGVLGVERIKQVNEGLDVRASDFATDDLKTDNLGGGNTENLRVTNGKSQWQTEGYFGRLNYNYSNKYYVSLNGRYDGSSVFGLNNKWAFFPSLALAWRPTQESFLQEQDVMSEMKIRASIGQTGNGNLDPYSSLGLWSIGPNRYSYGNGQLVNGASLSRIQNQNLKWETTTQYNIGLDTEFLNGKLGLTMDYYVKDTDNLILDVVIPRSSGFGTSRQNLGALRNTGFEVGINYVVLDDGDFHWDFNANMAFTKSKATDVGEGTSIDPNTDEPYIEVAEWQRRGGLRLYEGRPAGEIYGFVIEGVFETQEQADNWPVDMNSNRSNNTAGYWIYKDVNGDGRISDDDQESLGTAQPNMVYGFTHRFKYKAFNLSLFFQGVSGAKIVNFYGGDADDPFYSDYWTPTNTDGTVAINKTGGNGFRSLRFDSRQIQNGDYLRLKNIRLGFTVPTANINFLSGLNLYFNASNLLTFSKYRGYNPDASAGGTAPFSQGFDTGVYPIAKTFTFGINANF